MKTTPEQRAEWARNAAETDPEWWASEAVPALLTDLATAEAALEQIVKKAHGIAADHLNFGMEEIRRYAAANDLTDIRDIARAALAGKGGNDDARR